MPREEHKHIWLAPVCDENCSEGRTWCQDNVWGDKCDDFDCDAKPIKFIRADIVEAHTPTQEAYDAACKALHHWREEAARLGKIAGVTPREMKP